MKKIFILIIFLVLHYQAPSQSLYFPPIKGDVWETTSLKSLGWDSSKVDNLYKFLENGNTNGFLLLKDGKIVLEKYFGTFSKDSNWYWASAGKSLTAFIIGIAQQEGFLSISDPTNKYIVKDWTNCPDDKEDKITILNQITMTSGLDDKVPDNHCTADSCLLYLADADSRWAYHNAPYTLLEKVIENATGAKINAYTYNKVEFKTGMKGLWYTVDWDNLLISNARTMARYGILIQNKGIWNTDTLLRDTDYFNRMVNTSQDLNKSYGYLWWLNGKESYMVPSSQFVFKGSYAPDAPNDMFSALGKNGQILSISPRNGLILVRMGNEPDNNTDVPWILCNQIWQKVNDITHFTNSVEDSVTNNNLIIYPNPASINIHINLPDQTIQSVIIMDIMGRKVIETNVNDINIEQLPSGVYLVVIDTDKGLIRKLFIKT